MAASTSQDFAHLLMLSKAAANHQKSAGAGQVDAVLKQCTFSPW